MATPAAESAKLSFDFEFLLDDEPAKSDAEKLVLDADVIDGLETVGHLIGKVSAMWGTAELDVFLNSLIMDSRDGARSGLPVAAAADVLFLVRLNKSVRAFEAEEKLGVDFDYALAVVDEGDQSRLRSDAYDDPRVSRDTVILRNGVRSTPPEAAVVPPGGQMSGLLDLLTMLMRNRLLVGIVVVTLLGKLLWPFLKPLL